jgi:hypothetical protein
MNDTMRNNNNEKKKKLTEKLTTKWRCTQTYNYLNSL